MPLLPSLSPILAPSRHSERREAIRNTMGAGLLHASLVTETGIKKKSSSEINAPADNGMKLTVDHYKKNFSLFCCI